MAQNQISVADLPGGDKLNNEGATARGKLRAEEWNALVNIVARIAERHNGLAADVAAIAQEVETIEAGTGGVAVMQPMTEAEFALLAASGAAVPGLYPLYEA